MFGSAVTHFVGYEGNMRIREGEIENRITSRETYIHANFKKNGVESSFKKRVLLSEVSENHFAENILVNDENVEIKLLEYIPNAVYEFIEDKAKGVTTLDMMMTVGDGTKQFKLKEGDSIEADDFFINFGADLEKTVKPVVNITYVDGHLHMSHEMNFKTLDMGTRSEGEENASKFSELNTRMLYQTSGTNFVVRKVYPFAYEQLASKKVKGSRNRMQDALRMEVI